MPERRLTGLDERRGEETYSARKYGMDVQYDCCTEEDWYYQ